MNEKSIESIVDTAYKLYMPQWREEIIGLATFIKEKNPKVIVEIGTKFGGTFMIWNEICDGLNISIDLTDGIHGGVSKDKVESRNENFKKLYGEKSIFIEGDSHQISTVNKLKSYLKEKSIDFLFIDGDHTVEGVTQDYEMYKHLVKSGGYIGFHDINDTELHRSRNVHVCKLWNSIEGEKIEFNVNKEWGGIGVIKI